MLRVLFLSISYGLLIKRSSNLLRSLLSFFPLVCVCVFLTNCLRSEREDVCVEGRMQRSRIELDPDYGEVQVCRDRLTRVELQ